MTFFKVVRNGEAVDAGHVWLKWYPRHKCLMACEPREAQYAESFDGRTIYRFDWLNPLTEGAPVYPTEDGRVIKQAEYDDLIEELIDGETVPEPPEPEPQPEPEPTPEPEPEPEHRMTVQEMREKIAELTSMTAKDNYAKGSYFVLRDEVYQATRAIAKSTEIKPGYNCVKKSLNEAIQ